MAQAKGALILKRMFILVLSALLSLACAGGMLAESGNTSPAPIGYVAFFNDTGLGFEVYSVKDKVKTRENLKSINANEYRLAKKPGDYTFIIESSDPDVTKGSSCTIKVQIVENAITYATLQKFQVTQANTIKTYNLFMTQGRVYLPLKAGPNNIRDLLAMLDDEDMGTRYIGLTTLENICSQNQKITIQGLTDKLIGLYAQERYRLVIDKIKEFIKQLGNSKKMEDNDFILWDAFTGNYYSDWYTDKDTRYFNASGYNFANNDKNALWSCRNIYPNLPENFDVELTSAWMSGVTDYTYGLILGSDRENFYEFSLTKNGHAGAGLWQAQGYVKDYISWKPVNSITTAKNIIKIEVRGKRIKYYVNGAVIGTINNDVNMVLRSCGLLVQDKQWVCFNLLKIIPR